MSNPLRRAAPLLCALAACPSPPGPAECEIDGGGVSQAVSEFQGFLASLPDCTQDSDCTTTQVPCSGVVAEECGASAVAVPLINAVDAEEEASKLTAELCPVTCQEQQEEQGGVGFDCATTASPSGIAAKAVCQQRRCELAPDLPGDGGSDAFAAFCGDGGGCGPSEFCDISQGEESCETGGEDTGAVITSFFFAQCAPIQGGAVGQLCESNQECGYGSSCQAEEEPCFDSESSSCMCASGCTEGSSPDGGCPPGCVGPLPDGRGCDLCVCLSCPD